MGHAAGDSLLAQLADRLHHQVRREDTVARFAGDEFVIVCQDLTPADADQLADRIRAIVQAPFELMQREVFVGTSVGIACYRDGATAESLLHDADAAMYRAKEGGRRAAVLFDGRMHQEAEARLDLEAELNRAVERGELRIHYQPILDIKSRRPAGFEALLRWQHPRYGLLAPDRFIPLAEETGLIVPIGSWVLGEALRQAGNWRHTIPGAAGWRIAVNLSARQLQDPGLYAGVAEAIAASGVAPAAVELEITESVLMKDVDRSLETLTRLRGLGVGLAVDDFGTGYSSLGYLRRFPVTTLKIDRSFIDGLDGTDAGAGNIVEWITGLADALRLNVVAEGVETPAQLHELDRLNAQLAQGFLWAEPLPAAEVAGWHAALLPGKAAGGR
jgi:predicted signal transduction protein with EAL and GGDEF domain